MKKNIYTTDCAFACLRLEEYTELEKEYISAMDQAEKPYETIAPELPEEMSADLCLSQPALSIPCNKDIKNETNNLSSSTVKEWMNLGDRKKDNLARAKVYEEYKKVNIGGFDQ